MILYLWLVLVALCIALVIIGLARPSESAQALVGFFLLFLLSLVVINGSLEYQSGVRSNLTYSIDGSDAVVNQESILLYEVYDDGTTHNVGYWLAIASAVGFAGVLYGLRRSNMNE